MNDLKQTVESVREIVGDDVAQDALDALDGARGGRHSRAIDAVCAAVDQQTASELIAVWNDGCPIHLAETGGDR